MLSKSQSVITLTCFVFIHNFVEVCHPYAEYAIYSNIINS